VEQYAKSKRPPTSYATNPSVPLHKSNLVAFCRLLDRRKLIQGSLPGFSPLGSQYLREPALRSRSYGSLQGKIGRICSELRTFFPEKAFPGARLERLKLARWLIGIMYLGLASLPQYKDNGVLDWAWKQVIELEILTVKEEERLKNLPKGETARRSRYPRTPTSGYARLNGVLPSNCTVFTRFRVATHTCR
jgi:hypothetical protein